MNCKKNIYAFLIIAIVGSIWHFIYDLTGSNIIIGAIAPINESVWEHQKLLLFPTIFYSVFEYAVWGKKYNNYISAVSLGIFSGILAMLIFFYTYSGFLGYNILALDIITLFIGIIVMLTVKNLILKNKIFNTCLIKIILSIALIALIILFIIWTFNPPSLGAFTPPIET